jgi:hypothetical protein
VNTVEVFFMIYEWRIYEAVPGKMGDLNDRFTNLTLGLFKKHGLKVIGFWQAVIGTSNRLYYMLEFNDLAHRESAWDAFTSDPEWINGKTASERDGPLVSKVVSTILKPTNYSPMQ